MFDDSRNVMVTGGTFHHENHIHSPSVIPGEIRMPTKLTVNLTKEPMIFCRF